MSNLLISSIIPKDEVLNHNVSQAANNFCYTLLENDLFDQVVAIVPLNITQLISYKDPKIIGIQTRFFPHKNIFKILNLVIDGIKIVKVCKSYKIIWFYNLTIQSILSFYILKYFLSKKVFIIVADFTPSSRKFSIGNLIEKSIMRSNGIISLSSRMSIGHKNIKTIPGIVFHKAKFTNRYRISNRGSRKFLFSGTLENVTGFPLALEVFNTIDNAELIVSGRTYNGEYPHFIQNSRVRYIGFLEYDQYLRMLDTVDVCLSFRNPYLPENKNNFPSKILEYFSFNKIVISTILYPELEGFNYFYEEYNTEKLRELINRLNYMDEEDLLIYINQSELVEKRFSPLGWKTTIQEMENYT